MLRTTLVSPCFEEIESVVFFSLGGMISSMLSFVLCSSITHKFGGDSGKET